LIWGKVKSDLNNKPNEEIKLNHLSGNCIVAGYQLELCAEASS
jgi:hypothetical protein